MSLLNLRLIYAQAQPPAPAPDPTAVADPSMDAGMDMGGMEGMDPSMGGDMAGMEGDPSMGGDMGMGMEGGDMGGMDMGMGMGGGGDASEMANQQQAPRQEIGGPLSELALILHDFDIQAKIETTGKDPKQLAQQIWVEYGGDKKGGVAPGKVGRREDAEGVSEEEIDAEREATEDRKWERLPSGLNIAQVINGTNDPEEDVDEQEAFQKLEDIIGGLGFSSAAGLSPIFQKSWGATQASVESWVKLAKRYEDNKKFESADLIDKFLVISSKFEL